MLPAVSSGKEYHNMSSRELSAATDDDLHEQKGITRHDQADMSRMGKVQELRVCCC